MNTNNSVNQKAVVQEVGKGLDKPSGVKKIDPLFYQLLDTVDSWEIVEDPDVLMRFVTLRDLPELKALDESELTFKASVRRDLVVYCLEARASLKREESDITDEDFTFVVSPDDVRLPPASGSRLPSPFADRAAQISLVSCSFPVPSDEPTSSAVTWQLAPLGPACMRPNSPVRVPGGSSLPLTIACPVYDLDNPNVRRRIASYRSRVPTVVSKEDRKELRQKAQNLRNRLKGIAEYNPEEYEAQGPFGIRAGVTPEVTALLTRIISSIEGLSHNIESFTPEEVARDCGANLIDGAMSSLGRWLWIIPLVAASFFAVSKAQTSSRAALYGGLGIVLAGVLPAALWAAMQPLWTLFERDDYVPQASFGVSTLSHVTTLVMTYLVSGKTDFFGMTKDFAKSMSSYSRSVTGWKDLITFLTGIIESFINFVRESFGMKRVNILRTGLAHVDEWCGRVMDCVNSSQTGGDVMTPENVELLMALRNEGRDLTHMYRLSHEIAPVLHKYLGYLDHLCTVCSAAMHSAKGGRPPPVVIAVTGRPGVGKTFLAQMMMSYMLVDVVSKERAEKLNHNFDSLIFQKGSTEYWNGYCGQPGIAVDDWAQSIAVPGTDNDFIDLIRMNSCWSYPLNFADLENKGKNFFCSQVILLTTNIKDIKGCCDVIIEPEAITRRIDFGYEIDVLPEFATDGRLNVSKIEEYQREHKAFPFHAWRLRKHTFAVGSKAVTQPAPYYDLKSVLDEARAKIRSNRAFYEANVDHIQAMVRNEYAAQGSFWDFLRTTRDPIARSGLVFMSKGLKEWLDLAQTALQSFVSHPLVRILCSASVGYFIGHMVSSFVTKVVGWFFTPPSSTDLRDALSKKKKVDNRVLAQLLDTFRPEDFEVSVPVGDGYEVSHEFSREVLVRALARLDGATVQSNAPEGPKFVYRKVSGRRVVESDYDAQGDVYGDDIASVAYANLYRFAVHGPDHFNVMGHCLFVRDTSGLVPQHFIDEIRKAIADGVSAVDTNVVLTHATARGLSYKFSLDEFLGFETASRPDDDVALVKFPRGVRAHRDLVDKFIRESDLMSMRKVRLRLDTIDGGSDFIHRSRHVSAVRKDVCGVTSQATTYVLAKSFEYLGYTRVGDCGGIVCLEEAPEKQARRIVGIHVAGHRSLGTGLSNIVTQENLVSMCASLSLVRDKLWESQSNALVCTKELDGSFVCLNRAEKQHSMNPCSSLVKTPLFGKWGLQKRYPARLRPFVMPGKGWIYPMENALKPYATPVRSYDVNEVERAAYQAFVPFVEASIDHPRTIFDFETACQGVVGTTLNGIPRNTSPGYPYVLDGHTNKKRFFGFDGAYDFSSSECVQLKQRVADILDDARAGVRNEHIWIDFLKDELRSEEKVSLGMTRAISSAPLAYVVAFRQYFLAFTHAVQETRLRNGIAVGMNPYTEWDYLAVHLQSKGDHCVAGDFKAFDSSEQPDIHWAILDQINRWYDDGPDNARIRSILWMEVTHSRHYGGVGIDGAIIYQWNKSLPSGHPATSIINSFYNLTLFNMTWTRIFGIQDACLFWRDVAIVVYGDDNVLNIHPSRVALFNQRTISEVMGDLGMVYTSEHKTDEAALVRPLTDVSFLKRGFRWEVELRKWVGPQELDSVLYVPYWCKNKSMMSDIVCCNLEFTYGELALHPVDVWNQHADIIRTAATQVLEVFPLNNFTRREYLHQTQVRDFVWPI